MTTRLLFEDIHLMRMHVIDFSILEEPKAIFQVVHEFTLEVCLRRPTFLFLTVLVKRKSASFSAMFAKDLLLP